MTFEEAVDKKIAYWRSEYADLSERTVNDMWSLIAREVKKFGVGGRSALVDRDKLVTVAALAKLGWLNSARH